MVAKKSKDRDRRLKIWEELRPAVMRKMIDMSQDELGRMIPKPRSGSTIGYWISGWTVPPQDALDFLVEWVKDDNQKA